MKKFLLLLCFVSSIAFGSELRLKDKLAEALPGSYVVTEQNKNFTLVYIHARDTSFITIEEVSIPAARYMRNPLPWKEWFECGAPGHTSWTMSLINLETGRIEETFSFTHRGWVDLSDSDPFFTTLLNLRFHSVPDEKRRRIGTAPGQHKRDYRPMWNPLVIVNNSGDHLSPRFAGS